MTRAFYRTFAGALLLTATLALLGSAAHAQFSFSAPTGTIGSGGRTTFTIHPGDTLTFYGTLTNNYGDELDDVSILPTFAGSAANNFKFVYPQHLILGYPYTFNIYDTNSNNTLTITAKAGATPGTYVFYFDAYAAGDGNGFYTGDIYSDDYNIVVVANNTVPAAPTNLQAAAGNAQATLTWTAPAGDVTSYTLYRGTSATTLTALKTGITTTSFTNVSLKNGTTYYYAVAAVNANGTGPQSSTVSATPTGVPAAPTNFQAVAGNAQATLSWTAPAGDVTSYTLYRGTSASSLTALKSGITTTGFTNVSLKNGTTYYYAVAAVNSVGTGPQSSTVSATPTGVPAAPTNLQAVTGNLQATLSWTAPAGTVTSYTLYRGTSATTLTVLKTGITTTSFTNVSLKHGTTYYYTVSAVNSAGTGPASNEVSATP